MPKVILVISLTKTKLNKNIFFIIPTGRYLRSTARNMIPYFVTEKPMSGFLKTWYAEVIIEPQCQDSGKTKSAYPKMKTQLRFQ